MTRKTVVASVVIAALVLAACGSDKKSSTTASTSKNAKKGLAVTTLAGTKTIVTALVAAYNKSHPNARLGVAVQTAAAMQKTVKTAKQQIAVDGNILKLAPKSAHRGTLGRNPAVIAVSSANPHHVSDLTAFAATSGLHTQVCGAKTTFGNFTALVLAKAKIKPNPATIAFDCEKQALADVASGKLDAALMFRAEVKLPSGVKFVTIPDAQNIVVLTSYAAVGTVARIAAFEKFVTTPAARAVLTQGGYLP